MGLNTLPVPAGVGLQETQILASGTFTVPSNVTKLWCHVYGGGSSGRKQVSGSYTTLGGVAGAVVVEQLTVTPGSVLTATIGAGGAASGGSTNNAGNTSSFSTLSAAGGQTGSWSMNFNTGYSSGSPGQQSFGASYSGAGSPANSGAGGGHSPTQGRAGGSGRIIVRYLG